MSLRFFELSLPVLVAEVDADGDPGGPVERRLTVKITMPRGATAQDALDELAHRIEQVCRTHDWTRSWNEAAT
jgi:hypothetical protein